MSDHLFTWTKKPCVRLKTVGEVEAAYRVAYRDLRHASAFDVFEAVTRRPVPRGVTNLEAWCFLIYAVCDCGYKIKKIYGGKANEVH